MQGTGAEKTRPSVYNRRLFRESFLFAGLAGGFCRKAAWNENEQALKVDGLKRGMWEWQHNF
ncbi:hypothetical protein ANACOL_00996 [Anaerotruncus colihominis DSM 17241]|uniref:Uncharacterized protein n=1 Tax=Anaerotruncus colihominis DSM 17241 TaxID=445972 RepID=B0P8A7_9FIRM|nr:hypothetical protein ANACOL_00996 [Anaerotruncus colihominis DSM 17241]